MTPLVLPTRSPIPIGSSERDRASLRERIALAKELAIINSLQAHRILASVEPTIGVGDDELRARYFHARAMAYWKARMIGESFKAFEVASEAAWAYGEPALCATILQDYGAVTIQDGTIGFSVMVLEQALEIRRQSKTSPLVALLNLADALFTAGKLRDAAVILHEFHASHDGNGTPWFFLTAAAIGIPVGLMIDDEALLRLSCDAALMELAFSRPELQYVLAQIVEAFCVFYEYKERRAEHDALLNRALKSLSSLDCCPVLGIRVARLGTSHQLPRIQTLMSRYCVESSVPLRAHKAVFDSFIAARQGRALAARKLGLHAAGDAVREGRPFLQALALEAAGLPEEAQQVRRWCGASARATRLRWTGAALRRRVAAQLTPREHEVARLAAREFSNRAIALALGLSERTVHSHCRAIFGKLGVRSRCQLSTVLMESSDDRN